MSLSKILCVLLPLFTSTDVIGGFILSSQCVAPPPCTCPEFTLISCERNQLSYVPSFSELKEHPNSLLYLEILLGWNRITRVPANSFKNLSSINTTDIYIDLQSNRLNQIDLQAFSGIQAAVQALNLKNNNFTHLPSGLKELTALWGLNIDRNPLTSLDATTMSKIGLSLVSFTLSVGHFSAFPTELHFLKKIAELIVNNIPFSKLSPDAFQGLETANLANFEMSKSKLVKIPAAICHLKGLRKLTFSQSQNLNKSESIFENCNDTMDNLTILTLGENKLSTFPNVFNLFPNLESFELPMNNLQLIPNIYVKNSSILTYFLLSGNNFTRIPAAINIFHNLTYLNVTYNNIVSIGEFDLMHFRQLAVLDLSYNPLAYVSPNAFKHNLLLRAIYLDNTMLTRLPKALVGLPKLDTLSIHSIHIDCSCSDMAYLKSWNVYPVYRLLGTCSTGEDLKTYLTRSFLQCP